MSVKTSCCVLGLYLLLDVTGANGIFTNKTVILNKTEGNVTKTNVSMSWKFQWQWHYQGDALVVYLESINFNTSYLDLWGLPRSETGVPYTLIYKFKHPPYCIIYSKSEDCSFLSIMEKVFSHFPECNTSSMYTNHTDLKIEMQMVKVSSNDGTSNDENFTMRYKYLNCSAEEVKANSTSPAEESQTCQQETSFVPILILAVLLFAALVALLVVVIRSGRRQVPLRESRVEVRLSTDHGLDAQEQNSPVDIGMYEAIPTKSGKDLQSIVNTEDAYDSLNRQDSADSTKQQSNAHSMTVVEDLNKQIPSYAVVKKTK